MFLLKYKWNAWIIFLNFNFPLGIKKVEVNSNILGSITLIHVYYKYVFISDAGFTLHVHTDGCGRQRLSESTSTQLKTRAASTRGNKTQTTHNANESRGEMLTLTTRDRENTRPVEKPKTSSTDLQGASASLHLDIVNNLAMHVTFWLCFKSTDKSQRDEKHLWRRDGKNRRYIRRGSYRNVVTAFHLNLKSIPNDKSLGKLRSDKRVCQ